MKVLIACEFSGIVREAFRKRGHDSWSCDLLPTEIDGPHFQEDVLLHLNDGWDLMIAHPPCTYLCNAGVRHLHSIPSCLGKITDVHGEERWRQMIAAATFFMQLKEAPIDKICVENPIPHGYATSIIGKYSQKIQPWMFGHDASKQTCLWLKNLPLLVPTKIVKRPKGEKYANQTPSGQDNIPPRPDRWKIRSRTYLGIAEAMAEQWR